MRATDRDELRRAAEAILAKLGVVSTPDLLGSRSTSPANAALAARAS